MHRKWILLTSALFLFSIASLAVAYAQTEKAQEAAKTQVSVDEASGTVSIIVNGKAVAVFSDDGLLVIGNISYTGYDTAVAKRSENGK